MPSTAAEFEALFNTVPGMQYEQMDWLSMRDEARVELDAGRISHEEFQAIEIVAKKGQAFEQDAVLASPRAIRVTQLPEIEPKNLEPEGLGLSL